MSQAFLASVNYAWNTGHIHGVPALLGARKRCTYALLQLPSLDLLAGPCGLDTIGVRLYGVIHLPLTSAESERKQVKLGSYAFGTRGQKVTRPQVPRR